MVSTTSLGAIVVADEAAELGCQHGAERKHGAPAGGPAVAPGDITAAP